jgi:hypothetical protein
MLEASPGGERAANVGAPAMQNVLIAIVYLGMLLTPCFLLCRGMDDED